MNAPLARMPETNPSMPEPADRPWSGTRLALATIAAFWSLYFVLATLGAFINDAPAQDEMLARRFIVTLVSMGLTFLLYRLLSRFERASLRTLIGIAFAASLPLALAYASVNYVAFYVFPIESVPVDMNSSYKDTHWKSPEEVIVGQAIDWYFFMLAWAVMWIAIVNSRRVQEAERTAARYARAAQEAELRALRYQVNPHFLFNTLNSLSSLVMGGRHEEAERMILNLSTFFRASLAREASEDVPLAAELKLQLLYLDIEKVRFPERLRVEVDVPFALSDAMVPALILQPLVENAIKYGVSRSRRPVTVGIRAEAVGHRLDLVVEDDGDALPTAGDGGCGVGLANVRARLAARYGDAAHCTAGPAGRRGWTVRLAMPLTRDRRAHRPA